MTPDKKVEEYLVRAFDIIKNKFIEKSEFKIGNIVEIAKMIQLEEHKNISKEVASQELDEMLYKLSRE